MDSTATSGVDSSFLEQQNVPVKVEHDPASQHNLRSIEVHSQPQVAAPLADSQEDHPVGLGEDFEHDLLNLLNEYNANQPVQGSMIVDNDYEDARVAFERKQNEIAIKKSDGKDVIMDEIELKSLEEIMFRARKARDKLQEYETQRTETNSMFLDHNSSDDERIVMMSRPPARENALNAFDDIHEVTFSEGENEPARSQKRIKLSQSNRTKGVRKTLATPGNSRVTKRPQKARQGGLQNANTLNIGSLMRNDIVADARANQGLGPQPGFKGAKNKRDALTQLMASIPKEHRDTGVGMKKKLDDMCKVFKWRGIGTMKPDGQSKWLLKGMVSSLEHFQLKSTSWGVERERGSSYPFGGILADTMGFGKTIQMITIMVENQPRLSGKNRTTLIVVPPSIVTQWMEEIAKHTEDRIMEDVLVYKSSSSSLLGTDVCKALGRHQIVITTYHEVMRSYPKCVPPAHLSTEKAKDEWWEDYYVRNCGPLLQMPFYRIILDEAHMIKNHESHTSKACRLLTAKYKWVLTGTPLSNCMEELFPYFNFLGVEGSGTFSQFKHNYAKRNDVTMQRLDAILRKVMYRRTGSDRLFGAPLIALPPLDHQTVSVTFNTVEKAIYAVVRQRFIHRINDWSNSGKMKQLSRNILVMLIRLRQMCAHVLMVTTTMTDMLEIEDVEKLWKIVERQSQAPNNSSEFKTAKILRRIVHEAREKHKEARATPATIDNDEDDTIDLTINDADFDYRGLFYKIQHDGMWEKIRDRSRCCTCNKIPEVDCAKLSAPCGHFYCADCINALFESADQAKSEAECASCYNIITGIANVTAMERIARAASPQGRSRLSSTKLDINEKRKRGKKDQNDPNLKWLSIPGCEKLSSKIQAITGMMQEWINSDPEAKIVVFTLFIPIVKVLGQVCLKKGWGFQEYTGKTTAEAREKNLRSWRDPTGDNQILLMSMRAGGLGLNLTEASYVIIVDPWWNVPMEDQAFSRIYRIGQKRKCVVRRFVIADAIDTQLILRLQQGKALECDRVIDGRSNKDLKIQDLMKLFGPTRKDPKTGEIVVQHDDDMDALDEFIQSEDHVIVDNSDGEETMPAPARPREE